MSSDIDLTLPALLLTDLSEDSGVKTKLCPPHNEPKAGVPTIPPIGTGSTVQAREYT